MEWREVIGKGNGGGKRATFYRDDNIIENVVNRVDKRVEGIYKDT